MLARMPHRVFEEWLQFHQEEPFGQMPYRMAYVGAILGTLLAKPKGRRAWQPRDFMPDERPKPAPSPQRQLGKVVFLAQMFGAKIVDKKGKLPKMLEGYDA